jgi:hypothetical protein
MDHGFRIGIFNDVQQARHAISDVLSAGVSKRSVMMIVSEDEREDAGEAAFSDMTVHPGDDTRRGQFGGAAGSAIGAFCGSLMMYLLTTGGTARNTAFGVGLAIGGLIGMYAGSMTAWWGFKNILKFLSFSHDAVKNRNPSYDNWRSICAGAIGGMMGSLAGVIASYLLGIPNIWFFVTAGLYAAAMSVVVGNLTGAMSARGMAPQSVGNWEDMIDGDHRILVSVDCRGMSEKLPMVETLLRNDGASAVRVA